MYVLLLTAALVLWGGLPAFAECVVNSSTPTFVDGKRVDLQCDTNGKLKTSGSGGGSGDASLAEQQTQTTSLQLIDDVVHASDAAASKSALAGCQFDDTSPGTTTENNVKPVRCSTRREVYTQIRDAAGNERGVNVNAANALAITMYDSSGNEVVVPTAGLTSYTAAGATTNATNVKNAAGTVYGYTLTNTTTTIYYLRMYNLSSAPTCSSATGYVATIPIPPAAAAGGAGGREITKNIGQAFTAGIGFCITGGASSTDNTSAATGVFVEILYK